MNETPPTDEEGSELEALYRKTAEHSATRPSAKARNAILEHASQIASSRTHAEHRPRLQWRPAFLGSLAAASLACLLFGVQSLRQPTLPQASSVPAASPAPPVAPEPRASMTAVQAPSTATAARVAKRIQVPPVGSGPRVTGGIAAANTAELAEVVVASDSGVQHMASAEKAATSAQESRSPVREYAAAAAARSDSTLLNARDADGRTPLMLAVTQGRLDSVISLLRQGADPNAPDRAGVTPLQAARAQNEPEIVAALIKAGAR